MSEAEAVDSKEEHHLKLKLWAKKEGRKKEEVGFWREICGKVMVD